MLDSTVARLAERRARRHLGQLLLTDKRPDLKSTAAMPRLEPEECSQLVPLGTRQPFIGLAAPEEQHPAHNIAPLLATQRVPPGETLRPVGKNAQYISSQSSRTARSAECSAASSAVSSSSRVNRPLAKRRSARARRSRDCRSTTLISRGNSGAV